MPSLTLKNVPPKLLRSLRVAAAHHRRSLTQEVIDLLHLALRHRVALPARSRVDVASQVAAWRELAAKWQSDLAPAHKAEIVEPSRSQ